MDKFGAQRANTMMERMIALGQREGINFSFGGKTGNTRDSHRLIQLAEEKDLETQGKVVEELFKAYFEKEEDITSLDVLQAAGERAGLDGKELKMWLAGDKGGKQVDQKVLQAQSSYIGGVPSFTVQGEYQLEGAQDPQEFVEIFQKIKAAEI